MIGEKTLEKAVAGKRILIDSNIIIYLTDSILPFAKLSRRLFGMVERGTAEAVFSILSVAEVMRGLIKNGKMALSAEVHDYNAPGHAEKNGLSSNFNLQFPLRHRRRWITIAHQIPVGA